MVPELGVHIVYPGIAGPNASLGDCGHEPPGGGPPTGAGCFTHGLAVPANDSDPWLMDWIKPGAVNPIVSDHINIASRDPSTAWRTKSGEWRYVDAKADVYSTWDWSSFTRVGSLPALGGGDCPDFYRLPRVCDGCAASEESGATRPTHVRASTHYTLGVYDDGPANTTGKFSPLVPPAKPWQRPITGPLDGSTPKLYYAAKSFEDVSDTGRSRRIVWGWVRMGETALENSDPQGKLYKGFHPGGCDSVGVVQTNVNSLPREVTYDPTLQQLVFFPVTELERLRGSLLGSIATPTHISNGARLPIGPRGTSRAGSAAAVSSPRWLRSELRVTFALPLAVGVFVGVELRGGARADGTRFAVRIFAGGFDGLNGTSGYNTSSSQCPNYCRRCPPSVPADRNNRTQCGAASLPMRLKPSDKTLTLAVWTDGTFAEAFWMAGRSAWTVPLPCEAIEKGGGAEVYAEGGDAAVQNATAWELDAIQIEDVGDEASRT